MHYRVRGRLHIVYEDGRVLYQRENGGWAVSFHPWLFKPEWVQWNFVRWVARV